MSTPRLSFALAGIGSGQPQHQHPDGVGAMGSSCTALLATGGEDPSSFALKSAELYEPAI